MKRLWLILFLFSQPFSQTTVAVLEFETEGLDNISSSALSSIVRREVRNNKEYRLIDRNMMKAVLDEQGFQQSGCVSSECAVQVGELLGVQKMVTGTVSGLGSLYLIEIFVLDVATGLIEKSEMFEHVGRVEELIKPLRDNTKKLFNENTDNIAGDTFLYIESNPPGGMVYVNNNNIGSAPIKYKVSPGDYKVTIKTQGYQDWMQIATVELGENKVLSGELVKFVSTGGGSAGGGGIGEWEFWGVSEQDYIRLMQLNISKIEWAEKYQRNNVTVEAIDSYYKLEFPKNLWVKIFETKVPTDVAYNYYHWSIPIRDWSDLFNSEFAKISIETASAYNDMGIPFDKWLDVYKIGISSEQIRNIANNHGIDIQDIILDLAKMFYYGFENIQTELMDVNYLKWNMRINDIIFKNAKEKSITIDELVKKASGIDGGGDIFFTNDFTKLNTETQKLVYMLFDIDNDYIQLTYQLTSFRKRFKNNMSRTEVWRYAKPLSNNLSIGNIVLLYANDVKLIDIGNWLSPYSTYVFSE